jgi:sulfide:quinone oxidoreductase
LITFFQTHIYQPGWTLAGAGLKTPDELEKPQSQCIPANTTWIQSNAKQVEPDKNLVQLEDGREVLRFRLSEIN